MKVNSLLLFLATIMLMVSCQETINTDVELELEEKLVVFSNLVVGDPPIVYVSRSLSDASQPFNFETQKLEDAVVMLHTSDESKVLTYDARSMAYANLDIIIDQNTDYSIEVQHSQLGISESEIIRTPKEIDAGYSYSMRPDDEGSCSISSNQGVVIHTLDVSIPKSEHTGYYLLRSYVSSCSFSLTNDEACEEGNLIQEGGGILFSDECLPGEVVEFSISGGVFANNEVDPESLFDVSLVSDSFYEFNRSLTEVNSLDEGFIEPRTTFTNMSNGYGVLVSSLRL